MTGSAETDTCFWLTAFQEKPQIIQPLFRYQLQSYLSSQTPGKFPEGEGLQEGLQVCTSLLSGHLQTTAFFLTHPHPHPHPSVSHSGLRLLPSLPRLPFCPLELLCWAKCTLLETWLLCVPHLWAFMEPDALTLGEDGLFFHIFKLVCVSYLIVSIYSEFIISYSLFLEVLITFFPTGSISFFILLVFL